VFVAGTAAENVNQPAYIVDVRVQQEYFVGKKQRICNSQSRDMMEIVYNAKFIQTYGCYMFHCVI
jgi:hypothetical protein